ncbi:MAG: hypothetical protein MUF54_00080 [Polyangiaceae bacterium]|jgi:hypothetical protein|nr:hypothetical protein [Polyangiaceae bacterium]
MSDCNNRPNKDGSLRGDTKSLPDRGTGTGVTDSYGASLDMGATNRKGRIAAGSDPMMEDMHAHEQMTGNGHSDPTHGKGFDAGSDPVASRFPKDQRG